MRFESVNDFFVITPTGQSVTIEEARELAVRLRSAHEDANVILDLTGVTHLNRRTLSVLHPVFRQMRTKGGSVQIVAGPGDIHTILNQAQTPRVVNTICKSLEEALGFGRETDPLN